MQLPRSGWGSWTLLVSCTLGSEEDTDGAPVIPLGAARLRITVIIACMLGMFLIIYYFLKKYSLICSFFLCVFLREVLG